MTDDKPHEYVPHIVFTRSTARIELREVKADLRQANHDHTELLIERNNLAEALRQVNARLVDMTAERDAALAALNKATAKRDWTHDFDMDVARLRGAQLTLAQNRIEELERQLALSPPVRTFADVRGTFADVRGTFADPDFHKLIAERDAARNVIGTLSAAVNEAQTQNDALERAIHHLQLAWSGANAARNAARARVAELEAERDAARQSRKRAVLAAQTRRFHVSIEKASVNHYALGEMVERARAEKAEAGRKKALSQLWTARDERDTARQSRKRAVSLVAYLKAALRVLNHDFDAVEVERKAALERVTELEMQRNIFGEQVEFDLLQGRTLTARCAEYVASATFDVAGVAMEKVPAVPLGQALDELNQTAGELAERDDEGDTQAERIAELERELTFLSSIAHYMPEPGLSLLRPTATPIALKLQAHILRLWRLIETADGERDSYRARAEKCEAERDTDCRIVINPAVLGGQPHVRGTRIPVYVIVDGLADGMTPQELMEHFERLTIEDIRSAQAFKENNAGN